jgi:hypothetical protein
MSVRLHDPNSPANHLANVELGLLIALVRRAFSLHLVLEVDRASADGKCIGLHDAFSRKLQTAFSDIMAVKDHLESLTPLDETVIAIPRVAAGTLDTFAQEFRNVRLALRLKTGYAGLDCDKALRWADGDADRALARLIETNGYAAFKV